MIISLVSYGDDVKTKKANIEWPDGFGLYIKVLILLVIRKMSVNIVFVVDNFPCRCGSVYDSFDPVC
jgi:hypothetical protein